MLTTYSLHAKRSLTLAAIACQCLLKDFIVDLLFRGRKAIKVRWKPLRHLYAIYDEYRDGASSGRKKAMKHWFILLLDDWRLL